MRPADEKPLIWVAAAYRELVSFPRPAQKKAGIELGLVQLGIMPHDWKPMETVGPGTYEIRVRTTGSGGAEYRVFYVAKFEEAIYVLHAFEKKTQQTSQHNMEVGRARYAEMLRKREHSRKRKGEE